MGLEKYLKEPDYVTSFIAFLRTLNDETNIRSLYEQVRLFHLIAIPYG